MNKKALKLALKLLLTGAAIYLVFRKIDLEETWSLVKKLQVPYLLAAIAFFALSKVISSLRLNCYFRDLGLQLVERQNLKLYWIGMFYNLFLPGGIGGDGYKVYWLKKRYAVKGKKLVAAALLDRLSGLAALVWLMLVLWFFVDLDWQPPSWLDPDWIAYLGLVAVPVAFWLMVRGWFPSFKTSFLKTAGLSLMVQGSQLVCAYFILLALSIHTQLIAYQFVFLVSSIVAVLPLTIGGVGARELVFILSHDYMGIDKNAAVAFSLLFFLISAAVSLVGAGLKMDDPSQK
ncbi:hypothetical protein GCM10007049_13420 [Echinicola pacifica]|uniref:Lysylphosphatidylglycerol synthase TM region n=1 Tax=Echinicola pacifica TaxID=346377 RepID=A0A918PTA7_9BACT|nr:lysylphosphatidylglycerol synthase transmembrane domain-containing protein [Echinicola pacifica]GGZ21965.1 hypothetical protein GCM10007049_13420 [Echinicola pacifica]